MSTTTILRLAIATPLYRCFDYLAPANCKRNQLQPGIRVVAPFGRREVVGILVAIDPNDSFTRTELKTVIAILDSEPLLPTSLLKLNLWASDYYHHPLGEVLVMTLPKLLQQGKAATLSRHKLDIPTAATTNHITLNPQQQKAVTTVLEQHGFNTYLLNGVTGSGKTEVYLQIIAKIIDDNRQALILVPEIGLTPQTIRRFQNRFPVEIAVLHSRLTDRQRLNAWLRAKSGDAKIVIGTRSAIFTPLKHPGIIILDEEHDASFKQQSGFRYSARDLAIVRAKLENIPVMLGSATPSLESIYNVKKNKYQQLLLPERAGAAIHPTFNVIDLRNGKLQAGLSPKLIQQINLHLEQQGQILLFLNRRGYAPTLICHSCGWTAECKRCDAKMTIHRQPNFLQCHHCGATHPIISTCPQCQNRELKPLGTGTEKLEEKLRELFPATKLLRIDRDTTRKKDAMQEMLDEIKTNGCQILLGTQMLAKGHHFPNVTLAAILDADTGLLSSDFRATENIAQLIMQVAGRAGRAEKPGEVYIQTHAPENPLLVKLLSRGYQHFATQTLQERKIAQLPPFGYMALLHAEAKDNQTPNEFLNNIKQQMNDATILGPIAAAMTRRNGYHRWQLLIMNSNRTKLHNTLQQLIEIISNTKINHKLRWSLDVDPQEML